MMTESWDRVIRPRTSWFDLQLAEVWRFRDLIYIFVKRDFIIMYKQTILGPLWFLILPLFTTIVFTIVFGKVARIPTDTLPPFLFFLSGNLVWSYFAACLTATSATFISNSDLFGKVYFPRLIMPITVIITNMIRLSIQFLLFIGFYFYFLYKGAPIQPKIWIILVPLLVLQMALFGSGVGLIVSSMTTKYRDLRFALTPIVQLWMYASPIVYPLTLVPEWLRPWYILNPMASIIESFRFAFFGSGDLQWSYVIIGWGVTCIALILGLVAFNQTEKSFIDTI
jgi:lipopolysaccharide transport system permease protein